MVILHLLPQPTQTSLAVLQLLCQQHHRHCHSSSIQLSGQHLIPLRTYGGKPGTVWNAPPGQPRRHLHRARQQARSSSAQAHHHRHNKVWSCMRLARTSWRCRASTLGPGCSWWRSRSAHWRSTLARCQNRPASELFVCFPYSTVSHMLGFAEARLAL